MVYVDELKKYGYGPRCFRDGACHMTADDVDELHAMAATIGLKRTWFQSQSNTPHYDLTASKRALALKHGAVFKGGREQAQERLDARKAAQVLAEA